MLLQKSKSAAPGAERPTLAPVWLLLLLGGLILVALILIYPQQNLIQRVVKAPESELSSAYVTNLLRTDPDNPRLRLLLATQALDHGNFAELRSTLQPALDANDPALRREALWLLWQAGAREFRKLPGHNATQSQAVRRQLARQLVELAKEDWPTEQKIAIAGHAFAFGEPAVGFALYRQLAEQSGNEQESAERYAEGGKVALTHGQYRPSAELYLLARQKTSDPAQARNYYLTALRTLQSGNLMAEALSTAEREIGPLADDHDTLFFVTQLARAAGRPEIADRYIRRLLRLSLLRQLEQVRLAEAHGGAWVQKVSLRAGTQPGGPQLPFDDKTYTLGYEVFLENRKLDDAWKVAVSAVRQAPADMAWRERLAKVAEWTSRPEMALEHWWHLARETQRDDAWQSVLRLAPGLLNDKALIAGLQYQLARQPDEARLLQELVAAWERQGEPRAALDYLTRHNRRSARPQSLELMADLADRAADPKLALATWQRLFRNPAEATPPRTIRAATLALLQGDNSDALHWLELAQSQGGANETDSRTLLRLTGHLAQIEQRDELAIRSFTSLSQSAQAEAVDFDALIRLLEDSHPRQAASVAIRAWERFEQPRHLIKALALFAAEQQWASMSTLLGRMSPNAAAPYNALATLRRQPDFLRLSAAAYRNNGQLAEARRDLTAALLISPASKDLQTSLLWLLIDSNDAPGLRRFIASHEPFWRSDPEMHDGLAAAYLALSRPKVALDRYLTPHLAEHEADFLWLMNYADALDQNQQSDRAWRLRRHLLSKEWQAQQTATVNRKNSPNLQRQNWLSADGLDHTRRLARTRLLMTQHSGDHGLAALRELLRLDRDAEGKYSNAAIETAIGWLQDADETSAVRGHLWQQYARSQGKAANRPLWAEISVVLASDDAAALRPILEQYGERLPRYDRINAAQRLGDTRVAQSDAFATQDEQSDDDPLHMQLAESLLAFSDHAGFSLANRQLGAIDELLAAADWHLALTPRLALDLQLGSLQRRNRDDAVIRNVPDERFLSLRINWQHDDSQTLLLAEQRHSLGNYTPLQLEHEHRIDNRLSLRIGLGQHLPSLDSVPLRVAGMKDRAAFTLSYQPTRVGRISFEQLFERYEVQTGSPVGRGAHSTLTVAHALRDLEISAFWSTHRFSREASYNDPALSPLLPTGMASVSALQPSFFLPDNFDFYGLRLSTDMRYERQYTRALRPYGSLAGTWHSALGAGYDLRLGLAGSIFGADHFSLTWGQGKAGIQTGGRTRDLNFNYRLHY
ncbi:MAG: tetratricopeptide repeat protein [Azonexaceae bacterium]|nr:tetratricopeptide repeat protein [Azonexaceae bacterium]